MPHLTPDPEELAAVGPLQCSYGGFLFGRRGVELVNTNLYDLPEVTVHDVRRGGAHGLFRGPDRMGGAYWQMEVEVWPTDDDVSLDEVIDAFEPDIERFFIWRPGDGGPSRWRLARIVRRQGPELTVDNVTSQAYRMVVELHAVDPRWHLNPGDAVVQPFQAAGRGGIVLPFTLPVRFTDRTGQGSNSVEVLNTGNIPSPPFVCIFGPASNPQLQFVSENTAFTKTMTLNGTLTSGQTLEVDFDERTILLDGQNRYFWLEDPSTWTSLPPGRTEFRFLSANTAARASISWTSTRV